MAGIFIRRGDKMIEDSFFQKHGYWRNISLYVKGLVDEEKRRNKTFTSIFIVTDDADVMKSIMNYAKSSSDGVDEKYARQHLQGREILYNVFAPQACFNPFNREGFDQFLVNVNFLIQHSEFIVSHTDSNVGRYLEEVIYVKRQLNTNIHTLTSVRNAPDSLNQEL
ncbi:unnamed protein product [Didymodactylos carnosus]|uniref:Uncharacterized protein n=1 Tax=Didymodactylos carnosus TaxID=1234261 RepID=A0A8S2VXH2_9BILA|nr:unnamed protein product [Didymodactylos carnosus]CAF4413852.1 unnamed protein product [Didymodactylos carnosus]